jgi:hypothetical protein
VVPKRLGMQQRDVHSAHGNSNSYAQSHSHGNAHAHDHSYSRANADEDSHAEADLAVPAQIGRGERVKGEGWTRCRRRVDVLVGDAGLEPATFWV